MPQTLTDSWKSALGENWETTHELLLHTLGNLTLTGYNAPLSNDDFSEKKTILKQSHLELNKHFADLTEWGEQTIRQRGELLAERAAHPCHVRCRYSSLGEAREKNFAWFVWFAAKRVYVLKESVRRVAEHDRRVAVLPSCAFALTRTASFNPWRTMV